jgi:hypothetical protein
VLAIFVLLLLDHYGSIPENIEVLPVDWPEFLEKQL